MSNLFENISENNMLKLKKILRASSQRYKKNINVLSNVNRDDFIALIDYGNIELIYTDYEGNKTVIEELETGEVFGTLTSSIKNEGITCITKEDTQITFIEYNQITNDEIFKTDYYIIFIKNLIKVLTEQLNTRNIRIELLTKRTTRDKLLAYFKYIDRKTGNGSKTIRLPLTYTELASYLSIDRCAMTRELKNLKDEGFIEVIGKRIILHY
ncbi:MAG: Crp/Fnr family transcriptional regulator [Bacilli bacterium]|nr:Crp/Fnr family transcriptional regulator [Bacilli bacterium]